MPNHPNFLKVAYNRGASEAVREAGLEKTAFALKGKHWLPLIGGAAGVYAGSAHEGNPVAGGLIGGLAGAGLGSTLGSLGVDRLGRYVAEAAQAQTAALHKGVREYGADKALGAIVEEHAAKQEHLFGVADRLRHSHPAVAQQLVEEASSLGRGGIDFENDLLERMRHISSKGSSIERRISTSLPEQLENAESVRTALMGAGLGATSVAAHSYIGD